MVKGKKLILALIVLLLSFCLAGCSAQQDIANNSDTDSNLEVSDSSAQNNTVAVRESKLETLRAELGLVEDYSHEDQFNHGIKTVEFQKYIVLHDTEGSSSATNVISYWASNGNKVAAHFVINRDGSVYQCVAMDQIAHHVGFGNTGNNELFGVTDESRDDKVGTTSIGSSYADYGMNSYSIGIEMVHVSGGASYTEEQLAALDKLIAYIDCYYGFESMIIDHKDWRSTNSDTSPEFAEYLANYKDHRTHN